RAAIVSTLKSEMKRAIRDLHADTKRRPDRYVLFTNLHLTPKQKRELREAILTDYDQPASVHIEIVGASELKAFLNQLPHLRSAYFVRSRFGTWDSAWNQHQDLSPIPSITLVGRDKTLVALRNLVDDAKTRVIMLSGPQGVGKSRLALQATEHRTVET